MSRKVVVFNRENPTLKRIEEERYDKIKNIPSIRMEYEEYKRNFMYNGCYAKGLELLSYQEFREANKKDY